VADGVGELDVGLLSPLAFKNVEIGAANASGADADDDIQGRCNFWFWSFRELEVFVVLDDLNDFHAGNLAFLGFLLCGLICA